MNINFRALINLRAKIKFMKEKQLKCGDLINAHNSPYYDIGFYCGEYKNNGIKFIKLWFANDRDNNQYPGWYADRLNNPSEEVWFETL